MADSTGISAEDGAVLNDWTHVRQSIEKILTTPIGSRVMRREFGSELFDLIDAKMIQQNVLALYAAAAIAIDRWEPRYSLTHAGIQNATADGRIDLVLRGTYFPRGHLGDFTVTTDDVSVIVRLGEYP